MTKSTLSKYLPFVFKHFVYLHFYYYVDFIALHKKYITGEILVYFLKIIYIKF